MYAEDSLFEYTLEASQSIIRNQPYESVRKTERIITRGGNGGHLPSIYARPIHDTNNRRIEKGSKRKSTSTLKPRAGDQERETNNLATRHLLVAHAHV